MFKLTEIFSESKAVEIKEHFSSLRYLLDTGSNRLANRMQRLVIYIYQALLYDRLDILNDFLEETNIAVHRLSTRCVNLRNKEEADEKAKELDYFDWVNFLKRYNIPSDILSSEDHKFIRIGGHHSNKSGYIDKWSHKGHVVCIDFSANGVFERIGFFEADVSEDALKQSPSNL